MGNHRKDLAERVRTTTRIKNTLINALEIAHNLKDDEQDVPDNKDAVDAIDNAISCIEEAGDYLRDLLDVYDALAKKGAS